MVGCLRKHAALIPIAGIDQPKVIVPPDKMMRMFAVISAQLFVKKLVDVSIQVTSMIAEVQILMQGVIVALMRMKMEMRFMDVILVVLLNPVNGWCNMLAHATPPQVVGIFQTVGHAILHLVASGMKIITVRIVRPPILLIRHVQLIPPARDVLMTPQAFVVIAIMDVAVIIFTIVRALGIHALKILLTMAAFGWLHLGLAKRAVMLGVTKMQKEQRVILGRLLPAHLH